MNGPNPKKQEAPVIEYEEIELDDLEIDWDDSPASESRPRGREALPTLNDIDPLRHDAYRYDKRRDPTRDSTPTLVDLDPLRYDHEDDDDE